MREYRQLVCSLVAVVHVCVTSLFAIATPAHAQAVDVEPPVIEYESIAQGVLGDTQVFSTSVVDDKELVEVTLYYRFGSDAPYDSVSMIALAGTSIHTASVPTFPDSEPVLQYYLEARDSAGNRSIQGFAFDPLERVLVAAESAEPQTAVGASEPLATDGISTGRKVFYGVLGILAVGALAAAAGGSGGGGGAPSADDPNTVPLTITVDPL